MPTGGPDDEDTDDNEEFMELEGDELLQRDFDRKKAES